MVQPVLAAKNLKEGQKGANFTGWLKILDVPLYILPGILCLALYPELANPDEAYMTMVTNLFPTGGLGSGGVDGGAGKHYRVGSECIEHGVHNGYICEKLQPGGQSEGDYPYRACCDVGWCFVVCGYYSCHR